MAGKKTKAKKVDFDKLKPAEVLCPICRTILIEPATLPCDHAFCKKCFEDTMENANLVCPLCRLRVASWFRRAKKQGAVVNQELWSAVQRQYPAEVRNKLQGIDNDIEQDKPIIRVAKPGEIRKEYEKERQKDFEAWRKIREAEEAASAALIQKIHQEEEYKRQVEEEKLRLDEELAKKLSKELSAPSTSKATPRRPMKYGPLDRFIRADNRKQPFQKLNKSLPTKLHTKSFSTSPNQAKKYPSKEYTCHVLPVEERNPIRMNPANNLFADLDFKGILESLGQKSTKIVDFDRRKSICISGYKSGGSLEHSDIIDQECKFYFKPVDPMRKHHMPPTRPPLKVLPLVAINDGSIQIRPPSGEIHKMGCEKSAFARFSSEGSETSFNETESETSLSSPDPRPAKQTKRKLSLDENSPARKKGKRQLFGDKKNLLKPDSARLNSVSSSPFYGFSKNLIEESHTGRNAVLEWLAKCEQHLKPPTYDRIDINRNLPKAHEDFVEKELENAFKTNANSEPELESASPVVGKRGSSTERRAISPDIFDSDCAGLKEQKKKKKKKIDIPNDARETKKTSDSKAVNNRYASTRASARRLKSNLQHAKQKKAQEEADFALAKKLQAQFDLIQMSSRTRRGSQRQVTLDEMLSV